MLKNLVFTLLVSFYCNAQLHHSTISGQSATVDKYNVKVLQTVGQISPIGNYVSNRASVIHGFQQPFLKFKIEDIMINEGILAYPNPFNSDLNFKFNNLKPKNLTVDIYDMNGRFIKSIKVDRIDDEIKLDLQYLMSTEYIIRLRGSNINYSTKVIKK